MRRNALLKPRTEITTHSVGSDGVLCGVNIAPSIDRMTALVPPVNCDWCIRELKRLSLVVSGLRELDRGCHNCGRTISPEQPLYLHREAEGATYLVQWCLDCGVSRLGDTERVEVSVDLLERLKDGILY